MVAPLPTRTSPPALLAPPARLPLFSKLLGGERTPPGSLSPVLKLPTKHYSTTKHDSTNSYLRNGGGDLCFSGSFPAARVLPGCSAEQERCSHSGALCSHQEPAGGLAWIPLPRGVLRVKASPEGDRLGVCKSNSSRVAPGPLPPFYTTNVITVLRMSRRHPGQETFASFVRHCVITATAVMSLGSICLTTVQLTRRQEKKMPQLQTAVQVLGTREGNERQRALKHKSTPW